MSRREDSKKETRQLILAAARQLFARKGVDECTIRDIAEQAGVSPASVVVHFKSKTALLEAALAADIDKARSGVLATLPGDQDLLGRLMHLSTGFLSFYDQNRNLYRALIRQTIFEPAAEFPFMTRQSEHYLRFLGGMIEEEKNRREVRPEVDAMTAALAIFSLYLGALLMLFRQPEKTLEEVTLILKAVTEQYLQGIMARDR